MKKGLIIASSLMLLVGCDQQKKDVMANEEFKWQIDRFDDIKVLRYQVPDFDSLSLKQKELVYYLSEAALCGRDIFFDQNFKYNLDIRRTIEAIYKEYKGDRGSKNFQEFEKYLKKVWFANGIHHHYSNDKFIPNFTADYFAELVKGTPSLSGKEDIIATITPVMFDSALYPKRLDQSSSDMIVSSSANYYDGVTQKEAEEFYASMVDPNDKEPISYGLNSQLAKENGKVVEKVWKIGGMYSPAIEKIVYWLDKAASVAENTQQKEYIESLVKYYRSGDLKEFDNYNIKWVKDTVSQVDFVNGFIEVYGDPLGYKASWESNVNFKNIEATKRTEVISSNAKWFEENSPIEDKYKKKEVKGVSAKVITVAMLGGDCFPATPIGINLPNADWIRKEHGSKSVTIQNITTAYDKANAGSGFSEEFVLREEDRELAKKWGSLGGNLHTDLHECLGHGSGQLAPGTKGDELKNFGSPLEEARADLFALYYMGDQKLVDLGIMPSLDVAKATYANYMLNGLMGQLTRVELGKDVEQAHMRCRKLISEWCFEMGKDEKVVEMVVENGKRYVVVNDYDKLRSLFGKLLKEIQRIKSEGDFEAGKNLIEKYAIKIDQDIHKEVLDRYATLNLAPYAGFVNPKLVPVLENGKIVDIKVEYPDNYAQQMLEYSENYSFL